MIGAGELTDLNSPEFMAAFAEEQQLPTEAIPTPFEGLNRALRDAGGGVGIAPTWLSDNRGEPRAHEVRC